MSMFCYQCQEAAHGTGCTVVGACGKKDDTSALQDLLIYTLKGVAYYARQAELQGLEVDAHVRDTITTGLFTTITNANFDNQVFLDRVRHALVLREQLKDLIQSGGFVLPPDRHDALHWYSDDPEQLLLKSTQVGILTTADPDIRSLRELTVYGLKGMAAYAHHAANLGMHNTEVESFMAEALAATLDDSLDIPALTSLVLRTGEFGVRVMSLLDEANTSTYGHPEITEVNIGVGSRPGILISGHDLRDMEELLKQTEGSGVDVYTHSEMLPAHYYPAFKKYKHFVGNYGNAWWRQTQEFESFNGPILMTTNCITPPRSGYMDRIWTTGAAGYPGVQHIPDVPGQTKDFSPLIKAALTCPPPTALESGTVTGGFAHHTVLGLADRIVDAVKSGAIRKFLVMAGCDGRMKDRDYYTRFAQALPADTVILTAGCAKYRYNKLPLGDIGGIPRVLDAGQCNDSYSLAVIALRLKEVLALNDINELPIAYNIAWYEQKAVIVLLALLYLGVKNIHLGPTLPAFLSPNVARLLVENFGIAGIGTVDEDLKLLAG